MFNLIYVWWPGKALYMVNVWSFLLYAVCPVLLKTTDIPHWSKYFFFLFYVYLCVNDFIIIPIKDATL